MENSKTNIDHKHILTIFTYRYVFDQKNDIVNLRNDIVDLEQFPERLTGSYCYEWEKYNRKAMHEQKLDGADDKLQELVSKLSFEKQKELEYLLCIIEKTMLVMAASNIIVIKSEFKSYIEKLLKI